ncbi:MAG: cobalamin-dependent protein [Thermoanaerobaculia bacterium]|nr:cobalamin-dependent protein [Thermoanaerobaculia bacterium]
MPSGTAGKPRRILLSGVFGPYGVDDAWGRRENVMELFHNQVTKAQGAASFRFHHRSFGLYFLAENVDADVTVLDFPSRERFVRELRNGYDLVGISFIAPNFAKARDMARLVRLLSPGARIVLGGHGAAIEGIETLVDCDDVVRGEGIGGLRAILGQDPAAPVVHPVLPSTERQSILGIPLLGRSANLLVPGVGCVNACRFCSTSHFFGKAYRPFLGTGRELFETARQIADRTGTDDFFVMDENFLKDAGRALELLEEMERHRRYFGFQLFSSAEAIRAFGLDNMVRLGVSFVWIGVESATRTGNFAKNEGVDARLLTRELRDRGITVLASGILCAEHHTPANIQAEIDFMVGLEADMVQFMLLTPLPVTVLYRDMQQKGLLREDLPWAEWHGQKELSWNHPGFPGDAPARWLEKAFRADHEANSSTMYRVIETAFRGWKRLAALPRRDACLEQRMARLARRTLDWMPPLAILSRHGVNRLERERAARLEEEITEALGVSPLRRLALGACVRAIAAAWRLRLRLFGDGIQPSTIVTRYPAAGRRASGVPIAPVAFEPSSSLPQSLEIAARQAVGGAGAPA